MAWIIRPLQIADANGIPTGKWRMTAKSDEDGGGPFGCEECAHDTPEEAQACEKCDITVSMISGFPNRKMLRESEEITTQQRFNRVTADVDAIYEKLKEARDRIRDLEDLLTSARAIALREGEETAWARFSERIASFGIGSVTPRTFRVLPSDLG